MTRARVSVLSLIVAGACVITRTHTQTQQVLKFSTGPVDGHCSVPACPQGLCWRDFMPAAGSGGVTTVTTETMGGLSSGHRLKPLKYLRKRSIETACDHCDRNICSLRARAHVYIYILVTVVTWSHSIYNMLNSFNIVVRPLLRPPFLGGHTIAGGAYGRQQ